MSSNRLILSFGALALCIACPIAPHLRAQAPKIQSTRTYPSITAEWLYSAAAGVAGTLIAGSNRELLASTNTHEWSRIVTSGSRYESFTSAHHENGRFIVAGDEGTILTSTDLITWRQILPPTPPASYARPTIQYGNGRYVITQNAAPLLVSADTENWQEITSADSFRSLVFGNGRWVGIGSTTGTDPWLGLYSSTNLVNWAISRPWLLTPPEPLAEIGASFIGIMPSLEPHLTALCFGNGRFVAAGATMADFFGVSGASRIYHSTDGIAWNLAAFDPDSPPFGEIKSVAFNGSHFLAVGAAHILRSSDGITWQVMPYPTPDNLLAVTALPDGRFLATGANGMICTSSDGSTWQYQSFHHGGEINATVHASGQFVAVYGKRSLIGGPSGTGGILVSPDGHSWQSVITPVDDSLNGIIRSHGLWIATGHQGRILTSSDALSWEDHSLLNNPRQLDDPVSDGHRLVIRARFRDLVFHSTNGTGWTELAVPGMSQANGLYFINNRFIAPCSQGRLLVSTDGLSWETRDTPVTDPLNCALYAKGRYIIGGYLTFLTSTDGLNWTARPAPFQIHSLHLIDGWLLAGGSTGELLASRDGLSWERIQDPAITGYGIAKLASNSDALVIAASYNLHTATLTPPAGFREQLHQLGTGELECYGDAQKDYLLEGSNDLVTWTPDSSWTAGDGSWLRWARPVSTGPARFWRVHSRDR